MQVERDEGSEWWESGDEPFEDSPPEEAEPEPERGGAFEGLERAQADPVWPWVVGILLAALVLAFVF